MVYSKNVRIFFNLSVSSKTICFQFMRMADMLISEYLRGKNSKPAGRPSTAIGTFETDPSGLITTATTSPRSPEDHFRF